MSTTTKRRKAAPHRPTAFALAALREAWEDARRIAESITHDADMRRRAANDARAALAALQAAERAAGVRYITRGNVHQP